MNTSIHDPLAINLPQQIRIFLSTISSTSPYFRALLSATSKKETLSTLSRFLAVPSLTFSVSNAFRPLLFDLCARWLESDENTEDQLVAICSLLEPHEQLFPILYKMLRTPKFRDGPLSFITTEPSPLSINVSRLHRLLLAYYRILQANRELPRHLSWSLLPLSHIIWAPHFDNGARLLAIRCYSLQSGMGEAEREKLETEILGETCGVDCQIEYREEIDGSKHGVDGWVMPVIEIKRISESRSAIASTSQDYYKYENEEHTSEHIDPSELSPLVANIHGIFLLRSSNMPPRVSPLISIPTTVTSLRTLAIHVSLRIPTLLTSPPSSGKSLLLSHLAGILYPDIQNQIINIHLADTSLDPRSLLGSYVSSPTQPGTFEWKEGVLVRAMREGRWVVFEDIDRGSNEVLGVIKPLVESLRLGKWIGGHAYLEIPSRGRVLATSDFALFATRSLQPSRQGDFPKPVFFGAHKFHEVIISSPSPEELWTIVDSRFPQLAGVAAQAIVRLWESVRVLGNVASTREIGLRELEKICQRIQNLLPSSHQSMDLVSETGDGVHLSSIFPNPTLREDMYLEARDVFFGAGASAASARAHLENIAATIAEHLGLDVDRREWLLNRRTPEFDIEKDVNGVTTAVRIGWTRLLSKPAKAAIHAPLVRPFAMHRPAVLLLSRIATAVTLGEPVLLTGETGTGKTSIVTHLSSLLGRSLISLNLSHQTESSDLLGGFKPVDAKIPGSALQQTFLELFGDTFSRRKNAKFEESVRKAVNEGNWKRAVGLWKESIRLAKDRIHAKQNEDPVDVDRSEAPRKRRRVDQATLNVSEANWNAFERAVQEFEVHHVQGKGKFAFGFVEGPLVKALRSGDWVLLDEVNLASAETLECISGLLHGPTASITLTEQGSLEPVPRHPDFRLFACMNPATDVGKKDLPPNIRSRFTEIDVPPPDADRETLLSIVAQYIGPSAIGDKAVIMNVAEFYSAVKQLAEARQIADGSNHRPHFSMRTLARALTFAADTARTYSLRRSIWEGCLMAFTMVLDAPSAEVVTALAQKHLLAGVKNPRSLLVKEPPVPSGHSSGDFAKFGPFYLEKGPLSEDNAEDYILTPSVEKKLIDLARIILTRRFPVLIEGPTSSGKTSAIEYLARRTGHRFIRINNHEHTDIQEYIGSYVSDPLTGKLVFKDGLLVRALRNGDWIVLDELNLAPSDVLEALNRLLDDNRELLIPETLEVIRPHPHFMLFATQNPPGLYAGRKVLSRAFRNRFLEVHFEDVPQAELETILCQRCRIAPSYGARIVSVFRELQKRRQTGRVFESKHGFATLRDLFRWAGRDALGYQELAENGYMLLAERTRRQDDKIAVKEVIESVMKVKIDEDSIYNFHHSDRDFSAFLGCPIPSSSQLIWTKAMRRLYVLVGRALRFNEPVLLVGETGSGKTSVCQVYADATSKRLHGLNCHQNTETADLIGGLRPVRNRSGTEASVIRDAATILTEAGIADVPSEVDSLLPSVDVVLKSAAMLPAQLRTRLQDVQHRLLRLKSIFEWRDGPLVEAMRHGDVFLLDEISLADDSVLERLNSVLEPGRTIVLAERGGDDLEHPAIQAVDDFKLVATMNPGGDYGKKELSPALRNRFTEVWVPAVDDRRDLELIIDSLWKHESLKAYTACVLDFVEWLCLRVGDRSMLNLRDLLAWVVFSNSAHRPDDQEYMSSHEIFHHAAHMTFLDGLASLPQLATYSPDSLRRLRAEALSKLNEIVPMVDLHSSTFAPAHDPVNFVQLGSFAILKGSRQPAHHSFNFQAPTTRDNAMRVVRACQVNKPILLEGSPGVGKTSLIQALANIAGHHLCRINLSDQTDLIDLFGSDLPVEGGGPGEFTWKDAEFLKALQEGHWVLLDEMNLAPQAVLEGLNAILDHRGTVYIPELGREFTCHPGFRIFAAQNPQNQGGGRKGLPKSFVNRFTKVYIDELSSNDLLLVCRQFFPDHDVEILRGMITYISRLNHEIASNRSFARDGAPWEFNLRDMIRWGILLSSSVHPVHPVERLRSIFLHRFRTLPDRNHARALFDQVFGEPPAYIDLRPHVSISSSFIQIGSFETSRKNRAPIHRPGRVLQTHLSALESVGHCIQHGWLSILTGPHNSGKTNFVRLLADYTGNVLQEIFVNNATDTMDLLGSFEQVDNIGRALVVSEQVLLLVDQHCRSISGSKGHRTSHQSMLRSFVSGSLVPGSLSFILQTASTLLYELGDLNEDLAVERSCLQSKIDDLLALRNSIGRFEWVDGPLIRAMREGGWVLMDGANLCNPSVLDRLNSLFEPGGTLTLSERGYVNGEVQVIQPHSNFRMFMAIDPQYGELSRAMRNRGIEIALIDNFNAKDTRTLGEYLRLPPSTLPVEPGSHSLAIQFDLARRGMYIREHVSSPVWPSGRALDQDSASSALMTQAVFLPIYPSNRQDAFDALYYFIIRISAPAYLPYLERFLSTVESQMDHPTGLSRLRAFILDFRQRGALESVGGLRQDYSQLRQVPNNLLSTQPMDFYLNCLTCPHCDVHPESPHHTVLQILDLCVALFLDGEEGSKRVTPPRQRGLENADRNQHAVKDVTSVLEAIRAVGLITLESFRSRDLLLRTHDLESTLKLLGYAQHLRRAINQSPFDYSAVQAISKWISDVLPGCSEGFMELCVHAEALRKTVSLSSGLGLTEIWSALFVVGSSNLPSVDLTKIDTLTRGLQDSTTAKDRRLQAMKLLALHKLPSKSNQQNLIDLVNLTQQLEIQLLSTYGTRPTESIGHIEMSSILAELGILMGFTVFDGVVINQIHIRHLQEILESACQDTNASLLRLVPYQHMIWAADAKTVTLPLAAQSQIEWLKAVWTAPAIDEFPIGPSLLLHPTQLYIVMSTCNWSQNSLSSLRNYESKIRLLVRSTFLTCDLDGSRLDQMAVLLQQSILMIASSFKSSFNEDVVTLIRSWHIEASSNVAKPMQQLLALLQQTNNPFLAQAIQRYIQPAFYRLMDRSQSRQQNISHLGLCWIAISRLIVELYVPDAPVDPAAIQNCEVDYWRREHVLLSSQMRMHTELEGSSTGNTTSNILRYLETRLNKVSECLDQTPSLPIRPDVSRLHMFWSEVVQFQNQIISPSKVDSLLLLLEFGEEDAPLREQVIQQSISGFCQRLDAVYAEYKDISTPLQLALLYMRLGLRLAAQSSNSDANHLTDTSAALIAFPMVRSTDMLRPESVTSGQSKIPAFERLLLNLSAVAFERSLGINVDDRISLMETYYEQILRLWLIDRAKEVEMERSSESLYRRKPLDHDAIAESEMEEQEFKLLFPAFENVLEQETSYPSENESRNTLINPTKIQLLADIHRSLLVASHNQDTLATSIGTFNELRSVTLASLLQSQFMSLPDTLDYESKYFQFELLHKRLAGVCGAPQFVGPTYNFYLDSNVQEVKKAAVAVEALRNRLVKLAQEWPDQMVLQHLKSRCDVFLNLDLHSPIAKILSALEQLLMQSDDWEIYANRENTLKSYQQALTVLIVEWRRLELSCWQVLLESQLKSFAEGASEWWFRLYDATVRGPLDALNREQQEGSQTLSQYFDNLIPLLDDFIRSSPLGQFQARMELLRSFEAYAGQLASSKIGSQQQALNRVQHILYATAKYFSLFEMSISTYLSTQRSPLEQEIRTFIKLASWKDVNVHALKQSAQRTHHRLYKIIRKFREVMREPIAHRLQPDFAGDTESKSSQMDPALYNIAAFLSEPIFPNIEMVQPTSEHLVNLSRTFKRFDGFISGRIRSFVGSRSAHVVDSLAVDIIVTAKSLEHESVSGNATEKQEKRYKALLVRKRKALSDLLKELKRGGFATNVKPDVLVQQRDVRWIREQPVIFRGTQVDDLVDKSEEYFNRLQGCLPELWASLSDHHPDLTTRELQRGVMLLESAFSLALLARSSLAEVLPSHQRLTQISRRLKMVLSSSKVIASGPRVLQVLLQANNTLRKLGNALEEVIHALETINNLHYNSSVATTALEKVRAKNDLNKTLFDQLYQLVENVKMTNYAVLLSDEDALLTEVLQYFTSTSASLHQWCSDEPAMKHIFQPVYDWLEAQGTSAFSHSGLEFVQVGMNSDIVIDILLLNVQNILAICPDPTEEDIGSDSHHYIRNDFAAVHSVTSLLRTDTVLEHLDSCLPHLAALSSEDLKRQVGRLLPFLDIYRNFVEEQLNNHAQWIKALFKLNFVVCSILYTLAKKGFCKPPDSDEAGSGGDTSEPVGGVGLGEGSGTENVSKDIEDESQVEGLQGEEAEGNDPPDNAGDDDAIEMNTDFGGKIEDVPEHGSDEGEDSDQESLPDPEEQLGKLDTSDPSAVDEKLWGDEQGDADPGDEKTDQDHSQEKAANADVVAKEGKQSQGKQAPNDTDPNEEPVPNAEDEPLPEDKAGNEESEDHPDANGAPMDDYVPDANTLDLPDNMELDTGDEIQDGTSMDADDDPENDGDMDDGQLPDNETNDLLEESSSNQAPPEDGSNDVDEGHPPEALGQAQESDEMEDDGEEHQTDDAIAQPDITPGDGTSAEEDHSDPNSAKTASTGQAGGFEQSTGREAGAQEQTDDINGPSESNQLAEPQAEPQAAESQTAGSGSMGSQRGSTAPQLEMKLSSNPLRSLGDMLKEIQQRFDEILEGEDLPSERHGDARESTQVEYLHPDDPDHNMQALGPAGEEKVAKLNELKLVDEKLQVDPDTMPVGSEPPPKSEANEIVSNNRLALPEDAIIREDGDNEGEGAISNSVPFSRESAAPLDSLVLKSEDEPERSDNHDVEAELRQWQAAGFPDEGSEHIWRLYESLTHDLAYSLCEQLRLILEPTLATRLKGDYRTGKRLNMKKIISYIASDYTKDKIWLRRTRPSQREYQVLIALDDSKSMSESHSVHLAYETLALVSKALSRLEAGDIAIAKFGKAVDILHGFDEGPFSDQAGTKVMNAFRFNQEATNVLSLIDSTLKVLETARERRSMSSSSAGDLWQLEIIISDGICQDHDRLRTVLRKAEEQRVMIVFIIIDSLHATSTSTTSKKQPGIIENSILSMTNARIKNIDGRMELETERYLDSFPFEYYVVLRSVEALPDVLSDTLKQFLERISEE